jgi:hypothetical protein
MENFTITTYHFKDSKTPATTLSNDGFSWESTSVDEIVSQLLRSSKESNDGHLSDSGPSSAKSDKALNPGSTEDPARDPEKQCQDLPPNNLVVRANLPLSQVLLVVGDSRDVVESKSGSKVRPTRSYTFYLADLSVDSQYPSLKQSTKKVGALALST